MHEPLWWLTKDGDKSCLALYERHYSAYRYKDGRKRTLFCGPGEKIVLRTADGDACFVWRKFIDQSGQQGINCAVFRNESPHQSSTLIRQADEIADCIWPDQRHYTYVNPQCVRSKNPGFCFIMAGWRRCGRTQGGLLILERLPLTSERDMSGEKINWTVLNPKETKRTYHFADNQSVTFENVTKIEVRESGKHRIETQDGRKAFVCPGWLWLEIETPEWTC